MAIRLKSKLPKMLGVLASARMDDDEKVIDELVGKIGSGICLTTKQLIIVRYGFTATSRLWGRQAFAYRRESIECIQPMFRFPSTFAVLAGSSAEEPIYGVRVRLKDRPIAQGEGLFYINLAKAGRLSRFICTCYRELWRDGQRVWPQFMTQPSDISFLPGELGEIVNEQLKPSERIIDEIHTREGEGAVLTGERLIVVRSGWLRTSTLGSYTFDEVQLSRLKEVCIGRYWSKSFWTLAWEALLEKRTYDIPLQLIAQAGDPYPDSYSPMVSRYSAKNLTALANFFSATNAVLIEMHGRD